MLSWKRGLLLLTIISIAATAGGLYLLGTRNAEQIQVSLGHAGVWAPIIYIVVYVVSTLFVLPSTALNLMGGALFGLWMGTLWTSVAAVIAAVVTFIFTRTIGRDWIAKKLAGRWQAIDAEICSGGLFYMFSIRLLPIIPYGLVNLVAGLTAIRFRDYFWGTVLGTVPGILPFVMLGSYGLRAVKTGDILPMVGALGLIGMLVGGATWYRRRRSFPKH